MHLIYYGHTIFNLMNICEIKTFMAMFIKKFPKNLINMK